jgi:hypothetical protein
MSITIEIFPGTTYRKEVHLDGSVIRVLQKLANQNKEHLKHYMEGILNDHAEKSKAKKTNKKTA